MRTPIRRWSLAISMVIVVGISAFAMWNLSSAAESVVYRYEIVREFPHDPNAFCQGLVYVNGQLFEGTGKYGESELRRVRLETGEVQQKRQLDRRYFGEGIAAHDNKIYQITWRERVAFVYDKDTLQPTGQTFRYQKEGWGLTSDGNSLIMSDGTSVLRFLNPKNFEVQRLITVRDGRRRIAKLNELEYIDGEIYANVWHEDYVVRINPRNGDVTGTIDLRGLGRDFRPTGEEVLNGIAYDAEQKRLFVTGKNWPKLYEIRLIRGE